MIQAAVEGVNLTGWAASRHDWIEEKLQRAAGILFRNFDVNGAGEFGRFTEVVSAGLLEYRERSSPRSQVTENIYTSTDYPPDERIPLHSENSYAHTWPLKLFFFCDLPPSQGGETPIVDTRRVLAGIDPRIRDRFEEKRVLYVRNYGSGLGLSWQEAFQTSDKSALAVRGKSRSY